jgi:restriction endonuclease Mrr
MATHSDIQEIISEAVTNEAFRQQLLEDPQTAVETAGYNLTDEQLNELSNFNSEQLEELIVDVEERTSKGLEVGVSWP